MVYKEIELLAPARNADIGIEAIKCGADAVYIGASAYGARHTATNDIDEIKRLVDYAHLFGAKVYVTLNTILYDNELDEVNKLVSELASVGVDALITQDLALKEMNLPIPLHASTQMDNRDADKVDQLSKWGYEQVVLARELNLEQIEEIHTKCPKVKLEAFVHGALCVSYSGQCYASQWCLGRSANRGECAQFCRLAFDLVDDEGHVLVKSKHLLSLKDMNRSEHIERMLDAGVSSFKIEGRLKDVAYVKNVTAYYRRVIDDVLERRQSEFRRSSYGESTIGFVPNLIKSFNRGFTDYFLAKGRRELASMLTPKSIGEFVGKVKEIKGKTFTVSGLYNFANGDGLCFVNSNGTLEGFRINRAEGNRLFPYPMPKSLFRGAALYRNKDVSFEKQVTETTTKRTILVSVYLRKKEDGFQLEMSTEFGKSVSIDFNSAFDLAKTEQKERITNEIKKMGDTIYVVKKVVIEYDENYFIPMSVLAQERRELTQKMTKEIIAENTPKPTLNRKTSEQPVLLQGVSLDYRANVSNYLAENFYIKQGVENISPAMEIANAQVIKENDEIEIMTCKHCIRFSLGQCLKNKKNDSPAIERVSRLPMSIFLSLPNGERFPLKFDCRRCEMSVYAKKKK